MTYLKITMKKITTLSYREIDYPATQKAAFEFIKESGISKLPISITTLIKTKQNIRIVKYSAFARENNSTVDNIAKLYNSRDGFCVWDSSADRYVIFYNDTIKNKQRIRFTLAHELGHCVLGHHRLVKSAVLSRRALKDSEYSNLEKEANFFARTVLAPLPIIFKYGEIYKKMTPTFIQGTFDVSPSVSSNVMSHLKNLQKNNIISFTHPFLTNFECYIQSDVNTTVCKRCENRASREFSYCPYCGSKIDNKLNIEDKAYQKLHGGAQELKYFSPIVSDGKGRRVCPRCRNEEILDGFKICHICSTYIYNECVGYNFTENEEIASARNLLDYCNSNCGCQNIPENARFCPGCGALTTFSVQGLLGSWEDELALAEEFENLPF